MWQKAASPSYGGESISSAACAGQAHSRAVGTLQYAGTPCPLRSGSIHSRGESKPHQIHGSLDPRKSAHKRHLDRFGRFCTALPCAKHTQTDTQTT